MNSGPGPKTTWEDLANLGYTKNDVYQKANAARGNTMRELKDLTMNEGLAEQNNRYCYNVTKGTVVQKGNTVKKIIPADEVVWTYDNSDNTEPFTSTVSESWTESESATVSISINTSITVSGDVNIPFVADTNISVSIAVDASKSITHDNSHTITQDWKITAKPGEIVSLQRTRTTTVGRALYTLDYGVSSNSWVETDGNYWKDYEVWAMPVNWLLDWPKGTMEFTGDSTKVEYTFKIIRKKGDEVVEESILVCGSPPTIISIDENGVETKKEVMIADSK